MPDYIPVEYDPFAPVPVDHDPWEGQPDPFAYQPVIQQSASDPFDKPVETYGGLLPHTVRESDLYASDPRAPYEYIEPPAAGELPPHMKYPDEVTNLYRNVPRSQIPENNDLVYREGAPPPIIRLPNNTLTNPTYNWRQDNPHSGRVVSGPENPVIEEGPTPKGYQPDYSFIRYLTEQYGNEQTPQALPLPR